MRSAAAFAVLLLGGCFTDGPVGMFPGGRLRGESGPCPGPGDWERFRETEESELEVRPARPRSVRTWNVVHDGVLHLPADFLTPIKRWPYQVQDDPNVRVRIDGETFACRAARVIDPGSVEALRLATGTKYGIEPDSRAARVEVWWFRLDPRDEADREDDATRGRSPR